MAYRYKVIPFIGQSKGSLSPTDVAAQLEATISRHAGEGWEFYQLSDVNIEVQPGCFAGLFGARAQYVRFDQLIFRSHEGSSKSAPRTRSLDVRQSADKNAGTAAQSTLPVETVPAETVAAGTVPADEPVREPPPVGASKLVQTWWRKTDDELHEAAATLSQYTDEAREAILAELARRNMVAHRDLVPEDSEQETFCYHCGADVSPGTKVCSSCGKPL